MFTSKIFTRQKLPLFGVLLISLVVQGDPVCTNSDQMRRTTKPIKVLMTGATGQAGTGVLLAALNDPAVEKVTVLGRRQLPGVEHPKLTWVKQTDFLHYNDSDLAGHDACLWCLGISQTKVSKEEYFTLTHDYAVAALEAMQRINPALRFLFLSGMGADPSEKSWVTYKRTKGKTENKLMEMSANTVAIRPGIILPISEEARAGPTYGVATPDRTVVERVGHRVSEMLGRRILPLINSDELGRAMLQVALHGSKRRILENEELLQLATGPQITPEEQTSK